MADFLNELAAKNLGTAQVIVPRRAALFESATEQPHFQSVNELESISFLEEVNRDESLAATPQRTSRIAERNVFTPSGRDLVRTPHSLRTSDELDAGPSGPRISPISRNVDAEPEPVQVLSRLELFPTLGSTPADQPNTDRPSVQPKLHQTPAPAQVTADEGQPREKEKQSAGAQTQITAKPRLVVAEDHARDPVNPRMSSDVASKSLDDQTEKSEVPVINVTIGRVEVRAFPSPAPTRAVHTKPQTLSLDEYLQGRRNGGAR